MAGGAAFCYGFDVSDGKITDYKIVDGLEVVVENSKAPSNEEDEAALDNPLYNQSFFVVKCNCEVCNDSKGYQN